MNIKEKLITGLYVSIGALGAMHSKAAHDIYSSPEIATFMSSYQHDITAPIGVYFVMRLLGNESVSGRAAATFAIYSAGEIAQGLGLYYGTFDPKDFLAYAAGVGLAAAIDKLTFRKKKLERLFEE